MSSPQRKIDVVEFLKLAEKYPVVDVRSPSEYSHGHIPHAHNIPLFTDKEREIVGTKYKNEGRKEAILAGLEMAGLEMHNKLRQALDIPSGGKLLVHCWRGGMRSEAMAWLFSLGGIETEVLEGGYKSYRHYILNRLEEKRKYLILGGLTGSGKTEILKYIRAQGHQVVDLEGIASHKGSAFGSIGQPPQPTSEHFANMLFENFSSLDASREIWLEDESKNIGTVFMPDGFFSNMRESPVIAILMNVETRMPRLMYEYSTKSAGDLLKSVQKISKRLGGDKTREATESIISGNFEKAIEITLEYYDKAYLYGLSQRPAGNVTYVETESDDVEVNAARVLEASARFLR